MQGDIVKAAKWLGGCMVAASLILVLGFHPTVTGRVISVTKVQPETATPRVIPSPCDSPALSPVNQSAYGSPQTYPVGLAAVPAAVSGEPNLPTLPKN